MYTNKFTPRIEEKKNLIEPEKKSKPIREHVELSIHNKIHEKLDYFLKSNKIPHLLFHGSSGSGKRTIVNNFITKIYNADKMKIKSNVMFVNCAHGKGIKFIREDLKFFAKTNIQSNNGIIFKTIVLLNADYLTIDAQSALRRCIELFSYNTRFFIIVENKNKMLNPILSRFCEIYIPEFIEDGEVQNLHLWSRQKIPISITNLESSTKWVNDTMETFSLEKSIDHIKLVKLAGDFYENGYSCLDLMRWVGNRFSHLDRVNATMCFDRIKAEYRCEKLLIFYMLDFLFLRSKKDLECIMNM